ncbi:MAG TPA: hypothetical protein VFU21_26700 [Kofleriaceae bacterium]|nr:hypothetical protein [Kofleriaceae bacterium]
MKKRDARESSRPRARRRPDRAGREALVDKLLSIDDLKDVVGGVGSGCECNYCTI